MCEQLNEIYPYLPRNRSDYRNSFLPYYTTIYFDSLGAIYLQYNAECTPIHTYQTTIHRFK
jgi:hypothetical protein